ncbi:hypothetical protein P9112_012904 [Eukaryota sp. TZLM1-RC]
MSTATTNICRFLKWAPSAVSITCFSPDGYQLAVLRDSGQIEIWLPQQGWCYSHSLISPDVRVSAMTFVNRDSASPVLVVGTLAGTIHVYDDRCRPSTPATSYGGAVWSLLPHPSQCNSFLVGCDDGCIRIYSLPEDLAIVSPDSQLEPQFCRALERGEGKVLALTGYPGSDVIASGDSNGVVRSFSLHTNKITSSITSSKGQNEDHNLIRSLSLLNSNTLVVGDSFGFVYLYTLSNEILSLGSFKISESPVVSIRSTSSIVIAACLNGQVAFIEQANDGFSIISIERPLFHDCYSLDLSQCGRYYCLGSFDGSVLIGRVQNAVFRSSSLITLNYYSSFPSPVITQTSSLFSKVFHYSPIDHSIYLYSLTDNSEISLELKWKLPKLLQFTHFKVSDNLLYICLYSPINCSIYDLSDISNPTPINLPSQVSDGALYFDFVGTSEIISFSPKFSKLIKYSLESEILYERPIKLQLPITRSLISSDYTFLILASGCEVSVINIDNLSHFGSVIVVDQDQSKDLLTPKDFPIATALTWKSSNSVFISLSNNSIVEFYLESLKIDSTITRKLLVNLPSELTISSVKGFHIKSLQVFNQNYLILTLPDQILIVDTLNLSSNPGSNVEICVTENNVNFDNIAPYIRILKQRLHNSPSLLMNLRLSRIINQVKQQVSKSNRITKTSNRIFTIQNLSNVFCSSVLFDQLFIFELDSKDVFNRICQESLPIFRKSYGI